MVVSDILDTNMTFVRPRRQKTPIPVQIMRRNMLLLVATEHDTVRAETITELLLERADPVFLVRLFYWN